MSAKFEIVTKCCVAFICHPKENEVTPLPKNLEVDDKQSPTKVIKIGTENDQMPIQNFEESASNIVGPDALLKLDE